MYDASPFTFAEYTRRQQQQQRSLSVPRGSMAADAQDNEQVSPGFAGPKLYYSEKGVPYKVQPNRIENYVPGEHSTLSRYEGVSADQIVS